MNQFTYFNYAQHLEQLKYKSINESVLLTEADADPVKALSQVKSGARGGAYAPQWKQFVDSVGAAVDAGQKAGTIMVKHDNGSDMVEIKWSVDANNQVTTTAAGTGKKAETSGAALSDADMQSDVSDLVRMLDPLNPVYGSQLDSMYQIVSKYVGKSGLKDDDSTKCDAVGRLMLLYKRDENGDTLSGDIDEIGTTTLNPEEQKKLLNLKKLVKPYIGKEDSCA